MKTLTYVFWRIFKRLRDKDNTASPYFIATFYLGLLVALPIVLKYWNLISENTKAEKYIFAIILGSVCSIPFRFIFPKQKIENLHYSMEEEKKHKIKILKFVIGIVILAVLRLLYVKFI